MKIAVIIGGQARTWNYTKSLILREFRKYFTSIDYYVVLENTGTTNYENLRNDFSNDNLVCAEFVEPEDYKLPNVTHPNQYEPNHYKHDIYQATWYRRAWFNYIASLKKREYELKNNINYDLVFFLRPDIIFDLSGMLNLYKEGVCDPYTITYDTNFVDDGHLHSLYEIVVAGTIAADIYALRYLTGFVRYYKPSGDFAIQSYYCMDSFLCTPNVGRRPYIGTYTVRPWELHIPLDPLPPYEKIMTMVKEVYTRDEKIEACIKAGISVTDYFQKVAMSDN